MVVGGYALKSPCVENFGGQHFAGQVARHQSEYFCVPSEPLVHALPQMANPTSVPAKVIGMSRLAGTSPKRIHNGVHVVKSLWLR
jgi:hypothetical protein